MAYTSNIEAMNLVPSNLNLKSYTSSLSSITNHNIEQMNLTTKKCTKKLIILS